MGMNCVFSGRLRVEGLVAADRCFSGRVVPSMRPAPRRCASIDLRGLAVELFRLRRAKAGAPPLRMTRLWVRSLASLRMTPFWCAGSARFTSLRMTPFVFGRCAASSLRMTRFHSSLIWRRLVLCGFAFRNHRNRLSLSHSGATNVFHKHMHFYGFIPVLLLLAALPGLRHGARHHGAARRDLRDTQHQLGQAFQHRTRTRSRGAGAHAGMGQRGRHGRRQSRSRQRERPQRHRLDHRQGRHHHARRRTATRSSTARPSIASRKPAIAADARAPTWMRCVCTRGWLSTSRSLRWRLKPPIARPTFAGSLEASDAASRPSAKMRDPQLHHQIDEDYMRKVIKKYPGTRWADLAAYHLLDNKLCGEWEAQAKCPETEAAMYIKYVEDHPQSPKAAGGALQSRVALLHADHDLSGEQRGQEGGRLSRPRVERCEEASCAIPRRR